MIFGIQEIADITNAELLKSEGKSEINLSISTDTRTIDKGMIYLPLKGENFDGEKFIQNAVDNGAIGYFTTQKDNIINNTQYVFYVKDTKETYLKLAKAYKEKISPKTIMITGSSGKTTVKEMAYAVFSEKFKTHKTKLNHNNEIGLCQTMMSMPEDTEVLIVEGGMRGLGEIELIAKFTEPDISIITNVGTAHIGRLGSRENIAKAKCEITHFTKELFISPDDELIKKFNVFKGMNEYIKHKNINIISEERNGSTFEYKGNKYFVNQEGEHNIYNACLVIEAGTGLNMSPNDIANGLSNYKSIDKRWETVQIGKFNIINDCYNSNPDSMKAAIKTFLNLYESPKILILGDMGELGEDSEKYHIEIGDYIKNFDFDELITNGELSKQIMFNDTKHKHFDKKEEIGAYLKEVYKNGGNILLKASRSMKFEEIIEGIK